MDPSLLEALTNEVDRVFNNWTVTELCLPLCSTIDGTPSPHNIAPFAQASARVTTKSLQSALFLPPGLPSPDDDPIVKVDGKKTPAFEQITTIVANGCQLAGFRSAFLRNKV